jgi:hypothetical protein
MALSPQHQTAAEFIARFRAAYRSADRERLARLARWLLARIAAGDITDTQARNAFSMTAAQWTAKKAQMQALVDNFNAIDGARGD